MDDHEGLGMERQGVVRAWRKVLEADPVSDHVNFFDAGGNSILLVSFQQALFEEFSFKIPVREIFANPTIAALTARLQDPVAPTSYRGPAGDDSLTLHCLPYAGCSARVYDGWRARLPASIRVEPLEFPGRGSRCTELPVSALPALLEDLGHVVTAGGQGPYALFGHSFGALIAYELARYLIASGHPAPKCLFVSGCRAPHLATPENPVFARPDDDFKLRLAQIGGTPEELLQNDELMDLYIPVIRADYTILDNYRVTKREPLPCSVVALYGSDDTDADEESVASWEAYTQGGFTLRRVTGDHFFLHSAEDELLAHVRALITGGPVSA
ncbi:alpha/beta fold hydrolase [Streptomyces sp. NPDC006967]|uniref:alpha/beta fold hydrolase n=1 Tax=Streptomyces sp. NPDC006967 TaxID=3156906 RepID=UPI0033D69E76